MKKITITILTLLLMVSSSIAFGAARSWDVDKAHSGIYFMVDHIFSKVPGHFNDFDIEVKFDPAQLDQSSFVFTIEVDSIDTNITKRDKHLLSADFFDSSKFPQMSFVSTKITDEGNGLYNVAGTLTVKGQDYDMTLPLKLEGVTEHPAKKGTEVAGFNGTVVIDRLAHGVGGGKFYDMGVVGKEVEIFVSLEVLSMK
ncbi:MAG: YceI family protein [Desulfocapsaceae bacterium]